MLATISSQRKLVDASLETLNSRDIQFDSIPCFQSVAQLDIVDNPLYSEASITERNIFKQMKYECNRLYSYQNKWPVQEIAPESLAEAGLFYLQHEDKVQCPFCFIIIFDWTSMDNPLREHMRRRPKCPFLMGCDVGNVPLAHSKNEISSNSPEKNYLSHSLSLSYKPKHPRMADVKRRILTFSGWPLNWPTPQNLAECGLYYSGVADVVTCFFCGGTLGNWESDDDPWNEHKKFFPDCAFLAVSKKRICHSKFLAPLRIDSEGSNELEQDPVNGMLSTDITSDIIKQAQDIFPENLVLEAVKRKDGKILSVQEICDDILEQKQKNTALVLDETKYEANSSSSNVDVLLCKICLDKEKGAVFLPCGHFVSCWNCANLIFNCPVCRKPIINKIRTYNS